jgi:hypothetical protein
MKNQNGKKELWLNLFEKNNNIIKFEYELNMLSKEGQEISKFLCNTQW